MSQVAAQESVMVRLKEGTRDLHDLAESQEFQRRMVQGAISREEYAAWLGQMLLIHRALERPLREHLGEPAFRAVREEQLQERYLLADLEALGVDPESLSPLPATCALIATIEATARTEPLALLGYHYVLEGSNNGNRFIARKMREAFGLEPGEADRYLDPYGKEQRPKWLAFRAEMDEVGFSPEEIDRLVTAAREMFDGIRALSVELETRRAPPESSRIS